jgi:hypothetical protein
MGDGMNIRANPVYAQLSVIDEQWKRNHVNAMEYRDFEEWLAFGIETLERLFRFDEGWRGDVLSGAVPYDPDLDADIRKSFEQWLTTSRVAASHIPQFEQRFGPVEYAAKFRQYIRMVESVLTPDEQFFSDEALVAARDQAIEEHSRGVTEDLDDSA